MAKVGGVLFEMSSKENITLSLSLCTFLEFIISQTDHRRVTLSFFSQIFLFFAKSSNFISPEEFQRDLRYPNQSHPFFEREE